MKVTPSITATLLAGALAVAACGGSDDSEDSSATTASDGGSSTQADNPTRAEYVQELDALCQRSDDESEGASRRFDAAADRDDNDAMVDALDEVLGTRDEYMAEFDSIDVPPSEQEFHQKYREAVERGYTLSGLLRDAIEANDISEVSTYADDIRDTGKQRDALLDGHGGFEHCGSDDRN